jgi:hypothetical protein
VSGAGQVQRGRGPDPAPASGNDRERHAVILPHGAADRRAPPCDLRRGRPDRPRAAPRLTAPPRVGRGAVGARSRSAAGGSARREGWRQRLGPPAGRAVRARVGPPQAHVSPRQPHSCGQHCAADNLRASVRGGAARGRRTVARRRVVHIGQPACIGEVKRDPLLLAGRPDHRVEPAHDKPPTARAVGRPSAAPTCGCR